MGLLAWQRNQPRIPPKNNLKEPWDYDRDLYKLRQLAENAFFHLKQWQAMATRYATRSASFLAICQIWALVLWTKLL